MGVSRIMMSSIVLRFIVAAITSSASIATSASASDAFKINITEPLHRYAGPEDCSDSYDLVRPELLTFNVHVACTQQIEYSVIIINRTTNSLIPGCRKFCQQAQRNTCVVRCNVSDLPDTSIYLIKASTKDLTADKSWTVCINAKDAAQVSFVGKQPTDVWSADGSIQLRFEATGYPRPISYELSCDGRQTSVSPSGGFSLSGLPNGTTRCMTLAYTNRRLLWTEPLNVLIHVSPENLFTDSTLGADGSKGSSSPWTATSTTKSISTATSSLRIFSTAASTSRSMSTATSSLRIFSTAASTSRNKSAFPMITILPTPSSIPQAMPQPHNGEVMDDTALLAGIGACMMTLLAALVTFALCKRRVKKESQCSTDIAPAAAASKLSSSPGLGDACNVPAAPIINNNSTSVTIINNNFAFQVEHIDQDSEFLGIDESCSRHYDRRENRRGADDEDIALKDSLYRSKLLQALESLALKPPPKPPQTQLPNETVRIGCSETSQKHYIDMSHGHVNGQTSDNPYASIAIGRLSQGLISSALAASFKDNNRKAAANSATEAAGDIHYDLASERSTDSIQRDPALLLHGFLSDAASESDAGERHKVPNYTVLGAARDWEGSAFC